VAAFSSLDVLLQAMRVVFVETLVREQLITGITRMVYNLCRVTLFGQMQSTSFAFRREKNNKKKY
jgi:hypothetical protein